MDDEAQKQQKAEMEKQVADQLAAMEAAGNAQIESEIARMRVEGKDYPNLEEHLLAQRQKMQQQIAAHLVSQKKKMQAQVEQILNPDAPKQEPEPEPEKKEIKEEPVVVDNRPPRERGLKPERTPLGSYGFLDNYRVEGKGKEAEQFEWVLVNKSANSLELTLDFTGSQGWDYANEVFKSVVGSFSEKSVAWIRQKSLTVPWALKFAQKLNILPVDDATIDVLEQQHEARIAKEKAQLQSKGLSCSSSIEALLSSGLPFVDEEFPPVVSSLWDQKTVKENPFKPLRVAWRRPTEFMGENKVQVFEGGIAPTDIAQGRLGNCWFLCAVACLAEFPKFILAIYDDKTEASNKAGVYRVRLCVSGEWKDITMDDYIPCYPNQGPCFSNNKGPELWVMLLEKAYAKVHSSYFALVSGIPARALQDLTGFPVDYYSFEDAETKELIASDALRAKLVRVAQAEQLTAGGTSGEDTYTGKGVDPSKGPGLVAGHAYAILHAQHDCGITLLRLRNPWGRFEWNGDFGDESDKWTPELKAKFKPKFVADDGEFWMCWEDFLKHFSSLNICYVHSPYNKPWLEWRQPVTLGVAGSGAEAEGATDAFYEFTVRSRTSAFIAVHQQDSRQAGATPNVDEGVMVCKRNSDGSLSLFAKSKLEADASAQVELEVEAGTYVIMPYTSGAFLTVRGMTQKRAMLSVHADQEDVIKSIKKLPFQREALLGGLLEHCKTTGAAQEVSKGVTVAAAWDGDAFWILANRTQECTGGAFELMVDTSGSTNAHSIGGSLKTTRVLPGPGTVVMHALCGLDTTKVVSPDMKTATKFLA